MASVPEQPVLPPYAYVCIQQQAVMSRCVCSITICLLLNVSVQQQLVLSLDLPFLHQPLLPLDIFSLVCAVFLSLCCPWMCLFFNSSLYCLGDVWPTAVCATYSRRIFLKKVVLYLYVFLYKRCCGAPGCAYLRKPVLHLNMCFCASPGSVCLQSLYAAPMGRNAGLIHDQRYRPNADAGMPIPD
jgi:hypothetical protein